MSRISWKVRVSRHKGVEFRLGGDKKDNFSFIPISSSRLKLIRTSLLWNVAPTRCWFIRGNLKRCSIINKTPWYLKNWLGPKMRYHVSLCRLTSSSAARKGRRLTLIVNVGHDKLRAQSTCVVVFLMRMSWWLTRRSDLWIQQKTLHRNPVISSFYTVKTCHRGKETLRSNTPSLIHVEVKCWGLHWMNFILTLSGCGSNSNPPQAPGR